MFGDTVFFLLVCAVTFEHNMLSFIVKFILQSTGCRQIVSWNTIGLINLTFIAFLKTSKHRTV